MEGWFEEVLELYPTFASSIGDHRYDDRLEIAIAPEHRAAARALEERSLAALARIDPARLSAAARLDLRIFERDRRESLESFAHPGHLVPLNQFAGTPAHFARLGSGGGSHPFESVRDYENFLSRTRDFERWVDQAIRNLRLGMARRIVQPRVLMQKLLPQLEAHAGGDPRESSFHRPIERLPEAIPGAERERLAAAFRRAIAERIQPAYRRLRDFVADEYLPACRSSVGLSDLPGGRAWYDHRVRASTTTSLDAEAIHRIGLEEVARIRRELLSLVRGLGFDGDLPAFFAALERDPRFVFPDGGALLGAYRELRDRVDAALPRLFTLRPEAAFEIREVERFLAASAAAASYVPPSADGSRPGVFYVNTHDLSARPSYQVESIYLHEAVPGHHFQIAIQQELTNLPRFRRFGFYTAYVEGWALYAESLGPELGLYTDAYQAYGALRNEMWRAVRLVVDTGMHARGWSRERALRYMRENLSIGESDAVAEVERYIAIPGQALAYKIGARKIAELRARARRAQGEAFDVRAFHGRVLGNGALPLDVLDQQIDDWLRGD